MDNDIRDQELLIRFLKKCIPDRYEVVQVGVDHTLIRLRTMDSSIDFAFNGQGDFKWVR